MVSIHFAVSSSFSRFFSNHIHLQDLFFFVISLSFIDSFFGCVGIWKYNLDDLLTGQSYPGLLRPWSMTCEKSGVYSVRWLSTRRSSRFSRTTRMKWSIRNWTCIKITDRGCFSFFKCSHDCLPVCVVLASCSSLLAVFSMFCDFISLMSHANANDRDCELDVQWLIEWSNEQAAHRKKQEKHGKFKWRRKKMILPVDKRKSVCVCMYVCARVCEHS